MAKLNSYTTAGTKSSVNLPRNFQGKVNMDLLAQAVRVYQDRSHPGVSKVKTRGEMTLTTAKVWRQKGTGRARHGARSAPIFVGGGVAHGPKGVKNKLKLSKKIAKKSLTTALSLKAKEGKIILLSNLIKIKKTKEAQRIIDMLSTKENIKKGGRMSFVLGEEVDDGIKRAFRNIKNINLLDPKNLNALDVIKGGLLVFEKGALELVAGKSAQPEAAKGQEVQEIKSDKRKDAKRSKK